MNRYSSKIRAMRSSRSASDPQNVVSAIRLNPAIRRARHSNLRELGFSAVELLVVVVLVGIVSAISLSSVTSITRNLRMSGDEHALAAEINLARMRAAADFTHARVYMDLNGGTFHLEEWNKAAACWKTDVDSNPCTQTTSPVQTLAQGDSFGFGSITVGPTASTVSLGQAPVCTVGVAGPAAGATLANSACVEINSRGYPVDSNDNIVANDAIYLTNGQKLFTAIAVSISGQPTSYSYTGSNWVSF